MDNKGRPQFEAMIKNIEQARRMWDMPGLRGYSLVLLRLSDNMAIEDANESEQLSIGLELPHDDYLAQDISDRYPPHYHPELTGI